MNFSKKYVWILCLGILFQNCNNTVTVEKLVQPFSISPLFLDNMVLQQQEEVTFWGKASADQKIEVEGSWGEKTTAICYQNGNWTLKLPTPKAGGPFYRFNYYSGHYNHTK